MSAQLLDGKALSRKIIADLKAEVALLSARAGKPPRFMNIAVGEDPSAGSYARSQVRTASEIGIDYQFALLPEQVSQAEVIDQVKALNADPAVHGIMIHKPFPKGIDFQQVADRIDPAKDLEGISETNLGRLVMGRDLIIPCTPASVMALLASSGVDLAGKEAVVIGRSEIVGKPVMMLLLSKNATVTLCHSGTSRAGRLEEHVRRAEVLIAAMGRANFIKGEWVREGALVIDVGINSLDGKLVGDVEFDGASRRASFITPVPGGVGPVTAALLMKNGVETWKKQLGLSCKS